MQDERLDEVFKVTGELIKHCQDVMGCKTSHGSCTGLLLVVTALQEIHPCFDYIAKSDLDSAVKVSFGGYEVSLSDANLRAVTVMDLVERINTLLTSISSKGQGMINQLSEPSSLATANIAYLEAMISHFKTIFRCVTKTRPQRAQQSNHRLSPLPNESKASNTKKQEQKKAADPPRHITGWKWAVASSAMLFPIFLYALDGSIVAVIQAAIVDEFDALGDLSWNNVGLLMGATATVMFWGQVYAQFGAKWVYLFNVVVFEPGSAVCGAAPNMDALILGSCICGVGGAGLYVGVFTLVAATTTMAERPLYVSGTGLAWGLGTVLGPVVGGVLEQSAVGWRWAFYINLFIGAACAPAWLFLLRSKDPRLGVPFMNRVRELDDAGIILLVGCLVSLIMAINFGGVTYAWSSGQIIGLFVCAGVLFTLLAVQQSRTLFVDLPRRLIPVQFFRKYTVIILFICTSASAAGVRLLPLIIVLVVTISINGALMAKFGYYMPCRVYGCTVGIGVGVGMWIQASFSVAQAIVDPEDVPAAIGFITLAQFLGNTTALAIADAVFLNEAETKVQQLLPGLSASGIQAAISGVTSGFARNLSSDVRAKVVDAIVASIGKTYVLVMTSGALVAVLSLAMKREKLFITAAVAGI
ncbi:hypothetical protein INS49_005774 [Diaporthe citri]|uniref:uncharacterized protein n=1 Tax=Diaporthe citri TaxID=83186 RepID=UPI001C81AB13|nr:uncharacterized protein INS49_005774 [Diaporthe citri]KAG6364176.1 hypothetical protein INS49_005774 [Diaporthe citri]